MLRKRRIFVYALILLILQIFLIIGATYTFRAFDQTEDKGVSLKYTDLVRYSIQLINSKLNLDEDKLVIDRLEYSMALSFPLASETEVNPGARLSFFSAEGARKNNLIKIKVSLRLDKNGMVTGGRVESEEVRSNQAYKWKETFKN